MDVYNQSEVIPKGAECVALLECGGIWVISDKFGVSWRPAQMKVYKTDNKLSGYSFIDEDQEDEEETHESEEAYDFNTEEEVVEEPVEITETQDTDPLESGIESLSIKEPVVVPKTRKSKK